MGMSAGGGKGRKSDINVTPLVDVVLVLLIIFMVSMPILLRHITVEVPRKLQADEVVASNSTQIIVTGKADGTVEVDDGTGKQNVNRIDLAKSLRPMIDAIKTERVVFVDFEDKMAYGDVVSIMDTIKGLGKDSTGHDTNPVKVALKIREQGPPGAAPGMPAPQPSP
jgi:biopolymer transport protein TolR